jgi:SPP1 family predicted phage head-tail adaptor
MRGWMKPQIEAGKLRSEVTIQALIGTQDSTGQETQTWNIVATIRASIEPLTGREVVTAQQVYGSVNVKIRARYYPGITPKMRATCGTHVYDIQDVINVAERNREMLLMCIERVEAAGYAEAGA